MDRPIAVVVGLCAHGLQIARALNLAGVRVIALESNRDLPGLRTNSCEIEIVDDINGIGLIASLLSLADSLGSDVWPVLFLTNDTMVRTVGKNFDEIEHIYRLSWASCRDSVVQLLSKGNIEKHNRAISVLYPKSIVIVGKTDMEELPKKIRLPIILKPDRPLSAFKTLLMDNVSQIDELWQEVKLALPTIAQEFIPGDDSNIVFGALYMDKGNVLARFEGRKLRSRPMGHTTVATSERNDNLHELTREYFAKLDFSGPCSLEVKRDLDGKFWVLEPTVGRTDFWVGLCIQNGVNFPLIEFQTMTCKSQISSFQLEKSVWLNGQRDPFALIWLAVKHPSQFISRKSFGVFYSTKDIRPFLSWVYKLFVSFPSRVRRKSIKAFSKGKDRIAALITGRRLQ